MATTENVNSKVDSSLCDNVTEEKNMVLSTHHRHQRDSEATSSKYPTIYKYLISVPTPKSSNKKNEDKAEVEKEASKTVLVEHVTEKEDTSKQNEE